MKKTVLFLGILVFCCATWAGLQAQVYDTNEPEIGVVEHLGETIPMGLVFNNEKGENVTLSQVIDKPTILTLVYFDCPGLCSPLLDGVSDVIEKMDMQLGKDYQVLTISFNTNDTPERALEKKQNFLRKHSKEHADNWIYLTGDSANIAQIVNAVGFKYKKAGNDWIHPAVITVLSPQGKITRYLYGTNFVPFDVKMAIIEAQKGIARPTVNRILDLCYSYDPSGRRYVLEVTKVSGTIIIFLALVFLTTLVVRTRSRRKKAGAQDNPNHEQQ